MKLSSLSYLLNMVADPEMQKFKVIFPSPQDAHEILLESVCLLTTFSLVNMEIPAQIGLCDQPLGHQPYQSAGLCRLPNSPSHRAPCTICVDSFLFLNHAGMHKNDPRSDKVPSHTTFILYQWRGPFPETLHPLVIASWCNHILTIPNVTRTPHTPMLTSPSCRRGDIRCRRCALPRIYEEAGNPWLQLTHNIPVHLPISWLVPRYKVPTAPWANGLLTESLSQNSHQNNSLALGY